MRLRSGHMILALAALAMLLVGSALATADPIPVGGGATGSPIMTAPAGFDPTFHISISNLSNDASGSLVIQAVFLGNYLGQDYYGMTYASGEVNGNTLDLLDGYVAPPTTFAVSPNGAWYYDNLIWPGNSIAEFDGYSGPVFYWNNTSEEANIWSNLYTGQTNGTYSLWVGTGQGQYTYQLNDLIFTTTVVPEPGFVILLGLGLGAVAIFAYRRF